MEATDSIVNRGTSKAHAAVDSIAATGEQAAAKAKPTIDHVAAMAHDAVNTAAEAVAPAAEWLSEQGESLTSLQKQLMNDTCKYISAHPLKAVAIAFGGRLYPEPHRAIVAPR
jgi:ElaB/YqjD/DUF883 family membrane-anchored ribosome-binding protein